MAVSGDGDFILIDLGAVTKIGDTATQTTLGYGLGSPTQPVGITYDLHSIASTLAVCANSTFVNLSPSVNKIRNSAGMAFHLAEIIIDSKNVDDALAGMMLDESQEQYPNVAEVFFH